jgi:hypothetical protein
MIKLLCDTICPTTNLDFGRLHERDLHYKAAAILPEQMVAKHGEMFPTERPLKLSRQSHLGLWCVYGDLSQSLHTSVVSKSIDSLSGDISLKVDCFLTAFGNAMSGLGYPLP